MNRALISILFLVFSCTDIHANSNPTAEVTEIGIAVENIQQSALHYSRMLGIESWQYSEVMASERADNYPVARIATGSFNGIRIALLQPLFGESPLKSYLSDHGPGIFHVGLPASTLKKRPDYKAFTVEDGAGFKASWLDSYQALGINLFLYEGNKQVAKAWGEARFATSDLALDDKRVFQLGIVTDDLTTVAQHYLRDLGIGPWLVVDFKAPHLSNAQYIGAKGGADAHIKVAYAMWGSLQLELLMPVSGPTPHRDYLIASGAGAHHLSLGPITDHDQLVEDFVSMGASIQMQSDNGGEGRTATYLDTLQSLGFVLELTRPYKGPGTIPVAGTIPPTSPTSKTGAN